MLTRRESDRVVARTNRTLLIVAAVALLACCALAAVVAGFTYLWPVRSEIAVDAPEPEPAATPENTEAAPSDIRAESEAVAGMLWTSSSSWVQHVTDVRTTVVLRRPVIVVSTDIGPEQADLADEFASALAAFASGLTHPDSTPYTYHLRILSAEGDPIGAISATDERWSLDAPAPPTDAAGLAAWIAAVYGEASPESEAWTERITGIAAGPDGLVTISTDLDPASPEDLAAAQTIVDAVNSSGATFATGARIVFADGVFEWSVLIDGVDPYGP